MSNIITVRTLSQLPRVTDPTKISANDLFEICPKVSTDRYSDAGITYGVLSAQLCSNIGNQICADYQLTQMQSDIENIKSGPTTFSGDKTFMSSPSVKIDGANYEIVTTKTVQDIMANSSIGFINSSCVIHSISLNSTFSGKQTAATTLPASGNLYIYGWIADQGNITPAQAWVALEAEINKSWTKIALCPWSISTYSKQLGYVSFNVPVAKELKIRIATGFVPNMTVSGSQNVAGSLTDGDGTAIGFRAMLFSNT